MSTTRGWTLGLTLAALLAVGCGRTMAPAGANSATTPVSQPQLLELHSRGCPQVAHALHVAKEIARRAAVHAKHEHEELRTRHPTSCRGRIVSCAAAAPVKVAPRRLPPATSPTSSPVYENAVERARDARVSAAVACAWMTAAVRSDQPAPTMVRPMGA
jgi:hypothetical protein